VYHGISREEPVRPIEGVILGAASISHVRSLLVIHANLYDRVVINEFDAVY
jgi:hypothetical protein